MNYRRLLECGYEHMSAFSNDEMSRLEFLSAYIFDFTTYDSDLDKEFALKAVEVADAISKRTTFDYIETAENYRWFIIMCNMEFFSCRIDWGTSIRGAWWEPTNQVMPGPKHFMFNGCGLWDGNHQVDGLLLTLDQWKQFIDAIVAFAKEK